VPSATNSVVGCGRAWGSSVLPKLRAADGVTDERLRRVLTNAQMRVLGRMRWARYNRLLDSSERQMASPMND
jgi:hypothetical protein